MVLRVAPWVLGAAVVCLVVVALFSDAPTAGILAVAALVTAVTGFISAIAAWNKKNGK